MDLISCCMSTLDDRRAVDESGGGGRGNGAQRGGGQSHAAWSNLSRGRTNVPLDGLVPTASLSRAISLAELRFVREPFARCDPSETRGKAETQGKRRGRARAAAGRRGRQSQRDAVPRALAVANWPWLGRGPVRQRSGSAVTHMTSSPERLTSSPPTCFPEGGSPNARPQSFLRAQSPRPRHARGKISNLYSETHL